MGRPRKKIPENQRTGAKEKLDDLSLADQLMPLIFDKENMSILLTLTEPKGFPFVSIGEITDLGKSQKLVDRLNLMIDYGIVEKTNGNYKLTEFGIIAANFTDKLITMVKEDNKISKRNPLVGYPTMIQAIEKNIEKNQIRAIKGA